jgi:ketosteroid isomerase-like protein/CheY-like chemotaxis protein
VPHVVVLSQDEDTREALCALLEDAGFTTEGVASSDQASAACRRAPTALLIADLPRAATATLLTQAASLREETGVPVALVTGTRSLAGINAAEAGLAFVMGKPFEIDHFLAAVANAIYPPLVPEQSGDAALAHAYFERLASRDWEGLAALCTPDVVYVLPGQGRRAAEVRGTRAFRDFTAHTFDQFRDARFEQIRCVRTPTRVIAGYLGHWTGPEGREQTLPGQLVLAVRDGQIAEIGVRLDDQLLERLERP